MVTHCMSASFVAAARLRHADLGAVHLAAPELGLFAALELSCFPRHSDAANCLLLCLTQLHGLRELSSLLSTCSAWASHGDGAAWALSQAWDISVPAALRQAVLRMLGQHVCNFGAQGTCGARQRFFAEMRRVRRFASLAGSFSRKPVDLAQALQWAPGRRALALVGTDAEFFAAVAELANNSPTGVSGFALAGPPIRVMIGPSFGGVEGVDLSAHTHGGRTPFWLCSTRSQFASSAGEGTVDMETICAIHPSALLDAASAAATEAALADVPRRAVLVGVCPALARALAEGSSLPHLPGVKEWARRQLLDVRGPYVVFSSHCAALHPTPWVAAARGFYDVGNMLADQLVHIVGAAHLAAAEHPLDEGGVGLRPRSACCVIRVSAALSVQLSMLRV